MELHNISAELPQAIKQQFPIEIYDQGTLIAVAVPPDFYEEKRNRDVSGLLALMDMIGERTKNLSKEDVKELLEIDDEAYDALGLGH